MNRTTEAYSRENTTNDQNQIENENLNDYDPYDDLNNNRSVGLGIEYENMPDSQDSSSISKSKKFIPIYILCYLCNQFYSFEIRGSDRINLECGCKFMIDFKLGEFIKYIKKHCPKFSDEFGCKKHSKENIIKKIIYYCKDCKDDLCQECLTKIAKDINDTGTRKKHSTHTLIDLLDIRQEMEEINKLIEMEKNDDEHSIHDNVKNIIKNLLNQYEKNPSYNAYKSIKKVKKFLNQPKEIRKFGEPEEFKKINSIKELKENIKSPDKIYKIKIEIDIDDKKNKESMEDLNIFQNKEFKVLKNLKLFNFTNLKDIQALSSCKFPKLKRLIIDNANLSDNIIKIINNLELPEIKFISFYKNKITSPEIFNAIKNFKTLEKFYIGENPIDINKLQNSNIIYDLPPSLKELGLNNIFTKDTNHFIIDNLNIKNIKILYINADGFISLEIFQKIELHLEEFWLMGKKEKGKLKSIEEITHLTGKESIKKLILISNEIKDIEKLVDIIELFPRLELLNIEDNEIENGRVENVIKKIKGKGFDKLVIKC